MARIIDYTVSPEDNGLRSETFLRRRGYSAHAIQALKHTGDSFFVNGCPARFIDRVKEGDRLSVHVYEKPSLLTPRNLPVEILYADEDVMVVGKSAGMPIHPSPRNPDGSLANALAFIAWQKGEAFSFHCSNRLDQDTSGLTAVSRHFVAAGMISEMGNRREILREYVAFVQGAPAHEEGVIDLPLGWADGSFKRSWGPGAGEEAITRYRVLSCQKGFSVVQLQLVTGRTHQIRAHMAAVGSPLLGDALYGAGGAPAFSRQALHAFRLGFRQPISGEDLMFSVPLPRDMAAIFDFDVQNIPVI